MAVELLVTPEAEQDLVEAFAWYEQQRPGLGEEFLRCVDACIHTIARDPDRYMAVHQTFRRGLVRRFPYAIFYERINDTVTVYAIFHAARDPQKWRQRLKE